MTDTHDTSPRGSWPRRIGLGVLAIIVIVGLFLASNALTIAWQSRENLRDQIRADVRATVAAIKNQPLGTGQFTIVNAANDYAIGYDYAFLQSGYTTNIVPIKHNQAVDRILILPLNGKTENLSGALDSGSIIRGYRVVGVSLDDAIGNFAYSFDSKTDGYKDETFDPDTLGSSRFDSSHAALVYSQQPGQERLIATVATTLGKNQVIRVPGAKLLDNLQPATYARKATALTAFKLNSDQVVLHDRNGKVVAVPDAKWDAAFIIAQAPQESSIQFSTPVADLPVKSLASIADGGYLTADYRGLHLKFTFGERTLVQSYTNAQSQSAG